MILLTCSVMLYELSSLTWFDPWRHWEICHDLWHLTLNDLIWYQREFCWIKPYRTRALMYSGSHTNPDIGLLVLMCLCHMWFKILCELCELEIREAKARLFPRGEVVEVSRTFGVKTGLVILVDQRHETRIDRHWCLHLLYSGAQVG